MCTYQYQYSFSIISRSNFLRKRNVSSKNHRENPNTLFKSSNFFFENPAVCETKLKNIVEPDRPQMAIWHKRIKPLNAQLNPICYLLGLLGPHHFLHVSRIRVKSLTLRLLMSYIYIYIYMTLVA